MPIRLQDDLRTVAPWRTVRLSGRGSLFVTADDPAISRIGSNPAVIEFSLPTGAGRGRAGSLSHVQPGHLGSGTAAATQFRPRPVVRIQTLASQSARSRHQVRAQRAPHARVASLY
jgi:hypothetical protein